MKSFDIAVYGNLILDRVYCVNDYCENNSNSVEDSYVSPGAIANIIMALGHDNKLKLHLSSIIGNDRKGRYLEKWFINFRKVNGSTLEFDLEKIDANTSEAIIISDLKKKTRSSIVDWGACTTFSTLQDHNAKWNHILYIDQLPNLDLKSFKNLSKDSIISIDLCSSAHSAEERKRIEEFLPYVDYIFASSEEGSSLSNLKNEEEIAINLGEKVRGCAIIHRPDGSTICDGTHSNLCKIKFDPITKPLNVLGAGDNFAASFITSRINDYQNSDFETILQSATESHLAATHFIKRNI
jgi:sugar/nucleoside kinase (ribokinase family)|tara:strand:- start:1880 stop:2767 length:888 start_codon:yes stop_codon:yes gene_type:complete